MALSVRLPKEAKLGKCTLEDECDVESGAHYHVVHATKLKCKDTESGINYRLLIANDQTCAYITLDRRMSGW